MNPTRRDAGIPGVDDVQAAFWNSAVSRREVQKVFDEQSETVKVITAQMSAFSMSMAFVFAKLGIKQDEFEAFIKARVAQMEAAGKETQTGTPKVNL